MQLLRSLLLLTLASAASAQSANKTYQGFNSGSTLPDRSVKQQSDFEAEFKAAAGLHNTPGSFNSVRLYTNIQAETTSDPISAFPAAISTNTTILLGIWCSGTDSIKNELDALKSAIDEHGSALTDLVVGLSVGSEDLYRVSESGIENDAGIGAGAKTIISFIDDARDALKGTALADIPVGHVDSWSAWANKSNSAVIEAVDFVGTDLYPYYEKNKRDNSFGNVTDVFDEIYSATTKPAKAKGKPVWITETGWPYTGPKFGKAEATLENAEGFWKDIGCGKLFGRTNVWWYNLRDSNPDNEEKFAITDDLSESPRWNLTCPAGSGAPATINFSSEKSAAPRAQVAGWGVAAMLMGAVWALV